MSNIEKEKFNPVVEPIQDKNHRATRALIGALPLFSGTALEILNSIVEDPYNKRRTEWLNALSDGINAHNIDIERLKLDVNKTEKVLSAIVQSTDIALKTSNSLIHKALIELVLKNIDSTDLTEEKSTIFLATIRQMTGSHFSVLEFVSRRKRYEEGRDLANQETMFLSELKADADIAQNIALERLLSDLRSLYLIYSPAGSPAALSGPTNFCTMKLTDFAKEFLDFIIKI